MDPWKSKDICVPSEYNNYGEGFRIRNVFGILWPSSVLRCGIIGSVASNLVLSGSSSSSDSAAPGPPDVHMKDAHAV